MRVILVLISAALTTFRLNCGAALNTGSIGWKGAWQWQHLRHSIIDQHFFNRAVQTTFQDRAVLTAFRWQSSMDNIWAREQHWQHFSYRAALNNSSFRWQWHGSDNISVTEQHWKRFGYRAELNTGSLRWQGAWRQHWQTFRLQSCTDNISVTEHHWISVASGDRAHGSDNISGTEQHCATFR